MYATLSDLATYLGVDQSALPATAQRDLDYAEDVIKAHTMNRIDLSNPDHVTAARRATLAQYDMMVSNGGMDMYGMPTQVQIGSFQMAMPQGETLPELSPRARRILFPEGLLYRGVYMR
jgi:hypothetical protein